MDISYQVAALLRPTKWLQEAISLGTATNYYIHSNHWVKVSKLDCIIAHPNGPLAKGHIRTASSPSEVKA